MGQQEYDNFKRLIKEWLDSHPNEYADFVEEMNDKKFKGFFNIFNTAVRLVPKYKEAARKRIGDDRNPDFQFLFKGQKLQFCSIVINGCLLYTSKGLHGCHILVIELWALSSFMVHPVEYDMSMIIWFEPSVTDLEALPVSYTHLDVYKRQNLHIRNL